MGYILPSIFGANNLTVIDATEFIHSPADKKGLIIQFAVFLFFLQMQCDEEMTRKL